jgi:hypothetical protein
MPPTNEGAVDQEPRNIRRSCPGKHGRRSSDVLAKEEPAIEKAMGGATVGEAGGRMAAWASGQGILEVERCFGKKGQNIKQGRPGVRYRHGGQPTSAAGGDMASWEKEQTTATGGQMMPWEEEATVEAGGGMAGKGTSGDKGLLGGESALWGTDLAVAQR